MFKRIFLFLGLNILIVLTVSFILNLFHVAPFLRSYGLDYKSLAIFCLIWGMAGSIISLLLSRSMAKWMLGVQIIDPRTNDHQEQMLVDMVARLAQRAGLPEVPQVGIFQAREPNAFATGPTKRRSLVAVSTGLLNNMTKQEVEAVVGHEISHITNGDMVTMTLLQGIVNAFVMFLARVIAFAISVAGRDRDDRRGGFSYGSYILFTYLFEIIFMLLGAIVVAFFSRRREFRADKGSSDLLGKEPMIAALRKLEAIHTNEYANHHQSVAALMINRPRKKGGFLALFATHPPIEERIERLERGY